MANFSTNQVRHFYAASAVKASTAGISNVGDIFVGKSDDNKYVYFTFKGMGGLVRSDLIPVKNILHANVKKSSEMIVPVQKVNVVLDSTINSGLPVAGEDYILHINFRKIFGQSEDIDYVKVAAVHVTSSISTASAFYKAMALNIVKNLAREQNELVKVFLTVTGSTPVAVTKSSTSDTLSGTYAGIELVNPDNDWELGTFVTSHPEILVSFGPVTYGGETYDTWGVATPGFVAAADTSKYSLSAYSNGHEVADLEYFCMGERGDQYRMMGWPNYVKTQYMIDPSKSYDILTLHYAWTDDNEGVQKSEKDIQIAMETPDAYVDAATAETDSSTASPINQLIDAINTAVGSDILAEIEPED